MPPHERHRPTNVATAADWIRQCRRAGLYDLALYEKSGFNFDQLGDEGQMEVDTQDFPAYPPMIFALWSVDDLPRANYGVLLKSDRQV